VLARRQSGSALMAFGLLHLPGRHEHAREPVEHEHRHLDDAHHRHRYVPGDPPAEPHGHRGGGSRA
jgi:hypothetical protein